jgi:hypothetical protein
LNPGIRGGTGLAFNTRQRLLFVDLGKLHSAGHAHPPVQFHRTDSPARMTALMHRMDAAPSSIF